MTDHERQQILERLATSQRTLVAAVRPLTAAQWRFRESPERWSVAEIVEHLVLFEGFIRGMIEKALAQAAQPEKQVHAPGKEPLVLDLAHSRDQKISAREVVRPTGDAGEKDELLEKLEATRTQTLAFAGMTEAPLHEHFFPHLALGDLDCRQWLLVLAQHTSRHVLQIEEIQKDPAYPTE